MEIEKKYLVKELPADLGSYRSFEIEQGYLCRKPTMRIRRKNDRYIFTYKEKKASPDGVCCHEEFEREITREAYLSLREKVDGHLIRKTRYHIPVEGYDFMPIELDVFHGCLEGLVFAELEFPDSETAEAFRAPEWLGANVSDDKRYSNAFLSMLDSLDELMK